MAIPKVDRERFRDARSKLTKAIRLLDKCKKCNLDVADREEILLALTETFNLFAKYLMGEGEPEAAEQ